MAFERQRKARKPDLPEFPSLGQLERTPLYSEELGIVLRKKSDREIFKWFLASILFGGRISEKIAKRTYTAFERYKLLEPRKIVRAGWSFLVDPIMREGRYVRYDGRKSRQILSNCETLIADYGGSLTKLHVSSENSLDLQEILLSFYGVGPITANIFLREMRPYWRNADPEPLLVVHDLAKRLGLDLGAVDRRSVTFSRIEAGLIRNRKRLERFGGSIERRGDSG